MRCISGIEPFHYSILTYNLWRNQEAKEQKKAESI
jgi:hypothetical protein